MTVKECYEMFGGDYEGVLSRLMKDERILKYIKIFAAGEELNLFREALAAEKYDDAFRNVHNIKGVSLNLGLTPLHKAADVLCEVLRPCKKPDFDITQMIDDVETTFTQIKDAISLLG